MACTVIAPQVIYEYTAGDTLPIPRVEIENLVSTGFTFQLIIVREDTTRLVKAGTIIDDGLVSGTTSVEFPLLVTDLNEGTHQAQMKYTDLGFNVTTFVQAIEIRVGPAL